MKIFLFLFIPFVLYTNVQAQEALVSVLKIEIIASGFNLKTVTDHISESKNRVYFTLLERDSVVLHQQNISFVWEQKNLFSFYENRLNTTSTKSFASKRSISAKSLVPFTYEKPSSFILGSMSGYIRNSEYQQKLVSLKNRQQAQLGVFTIPSIATTENRTIDVVRIGNPNASKKVLITSLTHAREAITLMQSLYFIDYLLDAPQFTNHKASLFVEELLKKVAIYFVPIVNPDGWSYNEQIAPNGGGNWRKNRRNNGSGNFGVDINRNFPYKWSVSGSSSNSSSDIYHGPYAASEAETQALMYLQNTFKFDAAFHYHSYGNQVLYPYSYSDLATADESSLNVLAQYFTQQNRYYIQRSASLYPSSGDAADWFYAGGEDTCWAYTLESGSRKQGFWPHTSDIISLCQDGVYQNLVLLAAQVGVFDVKLEEQLFFEDENKQELNVYYIGRKDNDKQLYVQNYTNDSIKVLDTLVKPSFSTFPSE